MFGNNTFNYKINTIRMRDVGFFEVVFTNIGFRTNLYFVEIGIWGKNVSIQYDYLSRAKIFKVASDDKNIGILEMIYKWN